MKIATLFSGIGSVEHSLKIKGIPHDIVFACDIDKFARESYLENYDIDERHFYWDITKMNSKKYKGKIDLLVGGSPCQSFSAIGKRGGLNDDRGNLIYQFIRIVEESKPKVFIFENVKGLLTHEKGATWKIVKKAFEKTGYTLFEKIINSKDFEIPQSRNRLFVVGFRDSRIKNFEFPNGIKLKYQLADFLEKKADDKYWLSNKGVKYVTDPTRMKKRLTQINGQVSLCQVKNQQSNLIGDFVSENYLEKYVLSDKLKNTVLKKGETDPKIAKTILASSHKSHWASVDNYISWDDKKIRRLTPRECHNLMGFKKNYKIVVSDTQAYRQAGNSIVVNIFNRLLPKIQEIKNINYTKK